MLSTSSTCNCVVSFPKMSSDYKGLYSPSILLSFVMDDMMKLLLLHGMSYLTGKAIVLMGVSGAGKSTIGEMLGRAVHGRFLDADDYHSESNKEKMKNGIPLSEEDRVPWLEALRNTLRRGLVDNETLVLACSALQKRYREILRSADPNYESGSYASIVKFVLLDVGAEVLAARLVKRAAEGKHFMPATLLQTQLELLQIDEAEGILKVDATMDPDSILKTIRTFVV
ncbi:gluconokinase isoform X1 [Solanum pennellii]|uniref:Gluconokinase n=1 Tax=Solanum pennellii TaxID=28526 RepID=A0ABM1FER7_SOLPN|nr:gluconokinase isoform X1 [Solanum pennellii]